MREFVRADGRVGERLDGENIREWVSKWVSKRVVGRVGG